MDVLRGKFALGGDPYDAPRILETLVGSEVGRYLHLLPQLQTGQLLRSKVRAQIHPVEVRHLEQRTPGRSQFARFGIFGQHRPADGRKDAALGQAVFHLGGLQLDGRGIFVQSEGIVAQGREQSLQLPVEDLQLGIDVVQLLGSGRPILQQVFHPAAFSLLVSDLLA